MHIYNKTRAKSFARRLFDVPLKKYWLTQKERDDGHALFVGRKMFDYYGEKWKKKRKHVLRLDGFVCQIAKRYGRTEEATVVHHIYPADEYPEWAWEDWNLISVSLATHNKLENRKSGELTEMGISLQRRTVPGENWRKKRYEQSRNNGCKDDM